MVNQIFKALGAIIKWGVFLFLTYVFWLILAMFAPGNLYFVVIFVIIFVILNFPKWLLVFIIAQAKTLKDYILNKKDEITELPDDDVKLLDVNTDETLDEEDSEDEDELSATEEYLYKGSIVLSVVFLLLIIFVYINNKEMERKELERLIALENMKKLKMNVSMEPVQVLTDEMKPFVVNKNGIDYNIRPLAEYKISGVVVVKNTFLVFDAAQDLSPVDIGLVWGDMAKPEVYKKFTYYSNFRIMNYSYNGSPPLEEQYRLTHHSHNHIIPATEEIKKQVMDLPIGSSVIMEGYLVEVTSEKMGRPWTSSLKRDDHLFNSGAGCEIFYVESVTRI